MKRSKFRSKPILMTSSNLDRANNRITNVVAMQTGEAQGHGMVADQKTLQMMALLGNNRPRGVDGRFGHPGISENAMGKKLFTANNFGLRAISYAIASTFMIGPNYPLFFNKTRLNMFSHALN